MALVELHDTKYDKLDVYEFMARYSNLSIAVGRFAGESGVMVSHTSVALLMVLFSTMDLFHGP